MAAKSVLGDIKRDLDLHVGQRIRLKANKGRKKVVERNGVLERTYPNIFVVKLDEAETNERRVSFSYTDLLTEAVELVVCGEGGDLKIECHAR